MTLFQVVAVVATLLCALTAGFLFAFAVVVMPGIRRFDDGEFIRAFQALDRIIQNGQPLFLLMWGGSVVALVAAAVWGGWTLTGTSRLLVIAAATLYLLSVQLPTVVINVPLNNELQRHDVRTMDQAALQQARERFEQRWNRWNAFRTVGAVAVALLLLLLLVRV